MSELPVPEHAKTPLDIDELVGALSFYDGSDRLGDYLFEVVFDQYPDQVLELYQKLVDHEDPEVRDTAAVGIYDAVMVDEDEGIRLWRQLLTDPEPRVAKRALEVLSEAGDKADDKMPLERLLRLGKLGAEILESSRH